MLGIDSLISNAFNLHRQGNLVEAIAAYEKILKRAPFHLEARNLLGAALVQAGRLEEAVSIFQEAIRLDSKQPSAHYNLGSVLHRLDRIEEAVEQYRYAIALNPGDAEFHNNLGSALKALGRLEEAVDSYKKSLGLRPNSAETRINLAATYFLLGQYELSLLQTEKSLAINPSLAEAQINYALALQALNKHDDALHYLDLTLKASPEKKGLLWVKATMCLSLERFSEGWSLFESRFSDVIQNVAERTHSIPRWDGKRLEGTLSAWGEQGIGDLILYSSMVPDVFPHVRKLIIEIDPRLVSLFSRSFPDAELSSFDEDPTKIGAAAHVPLGSLGVFFRQRAEDFPRKAYLMPDRERAKSLRQRLPEDKTLVGISWRSVNLNYGNRKTARLDDFLPLFRQADIQAIDLQYGDTTLEIQNFREEHKIEVLHLDEIDNMNDIDGLASLMEACDAIVTVSNTTAHIAGAIGKPVWVLVPFHGRSLLWHWFKDRKDNLWYPEARICRQQKGQPWADLIASVTPEILEFLQAKKPGA